MSHNALYELLHATQAKDLLAERKEQSKPVTVSTEDSVEAVVKVLSDNKILSAPVLDKTGECVGFVDRLDILRFIVSAAPDKRQLEQNELASLEIAGRAIALVPVKSIVDFSGRDPLVPLFETSPASQLAEAFAKGLHRSTLFSKDKDLSAIVSQSDIVRFLHASDLHKGKCKLVGEKTLAELGYASEEICTVSRDDTVLAALQRMADKGVSALAVVDPESGRLVGNFSASDLRGLYREKFPHLLDSVGKFLEDHSPNSLKPVVSEPSSTLATTVAELVKSGLHHLWVVDDFKPVGIIALTDIMRIVVAKN